VDPFDLKTALFAKHAQHVVLIHFPIALFLVAVMFDLIARLANKPTLVAVAYYNMIVAAFTSLPVLASGILAWRWQLRSQPLHGLLLQHLSLGVASSIMMWLSLWLHRRSAAKPDRRVPGYRLALELLGACCVTLTAHLGGFLSGVNLSD
jgi:uncharacterized membrane protein